MEISEEWFGFGLIIVTIMVAFFVYVWPSVKAWNNKHGQKIANFLLRRGGRYDRQDWWV